MNLTATMITMSKIQRQRLETAASMTNGCGGNYSFSNVLPGVLTCCRLLRSPVTTILIGSSEKPFLLCRHSLFFRHMLGISHFREGQEDMVKLPEDDKMCFSVFAEWLYIGKECDTGEVSKARPPTRTYLATRQILKPAGTMTIQEGTD